MSGVASRPPGDVPFVDARQVSANDPLPELPEAARAALSRVVGWIDAFLNCPHPAVGRPGEVCPWTRHTFDLGKLLLAPIGSTDPGEVDGILLDMRERFLATEPTRGPDAAFRSVIGVFYGLRPDHMAEFMVATHTRLKPTFLDRGLMLGEFYPTCPKPGLRNPDFRPLTSPVPLLVIRTMIEPDVEFLLNGDAFIAAYLRAHRARGVERLARVLEQRPVGLDPERLAHLTELANGYREIYGVPSRPFSERPSERPPG